MSAFPLPDDDVDLEIEPITGWRVWKLQHTRRGIVLGSLIHPALWVPGVPMTARCAAGAHEAPAARCRCGVYAADSLQALINAGVLGKGTVIGTVSMWGTVVEHATGKRSSLAYPSRLRLLCIICGDEPTLVSDDGDDTLVASCHRHRQGRGRPAADVQAELLSAYAVDLLPAVDLPVKSHGPVRNPPTPLTPSTPHLVIRALMMIASVVINILGALFALWAFLGFALVVLAIVGGVVTVALRAVGVIEDEPPPGLVSLAVTPEPVPLVVPGSQGASAAADPDSSDPLPPEGLAMVCGRPSMGSIVQVPCAPGEDLVGFATNRVDGMEEDCLPDVASYSRGDGWAVCWHWVGPEPVEVPLHTTTTNPFRGGDDGDR